jgi:hypothetical protein
LGNNEDVAKDDCSVKKASISTDRLQCNLACKLWSAADLEELVVFADLAELWREREDSDAVDGGRGGNRPGR